MDLNFNLPERPKSAVPFTSETSAETGRNTEKTVEASVTGTSMGKAHYYSQLSVMLFEKSFEDNPLFPEDLDRVHSWFVKELTDAQKVVCLHELLSQVTPSQQKFLFTSVSFDTSLPSTAAEEPGVWKNLETSEGREESYILSLSRSNSKTDSNHGVENRFKSLDLTTFSPNGDSSLFSGVDTASKYKLPSDKSSSSQAKQTPQSPPSSSGCIDDFKIQIESSFYEELFKSGINFDFEATAREHEMILLEAASSEDIYINSTPPKTPSVVDHQTAAPPGFLSPMATEFRPSEPSCHSEVFFTDFSGWLRLLRLHKYFDTLSRLHAQNPHSLLNTTDADLEAVGVSALGARKKFLRLFERIKMENFECQ